MNYEIMCQLGIIQTAIKNIRFELLKEPKIAFTIKLAYYTLKIAAYVIKIVR